jgi:ion channel-forming bestrophin family protein
MRSEKERGFLQEAFALEGSITALVMPEVVIFGLVAAGCCAVAWFMERYFGVRVGLEVAPYEVGGVVLGLLLVARTNAGYDRWWEGRKLWGGIVNQSRNLVIGALSYGPRDAVWREKFVAWAAVFPHVARCSLRGERPSPEVAGLVGQSDADQVASADHMPSFVALKLALLLREACDHFNMDRFAFLQIDKERAMLIDHIGASERILKTPLPLVYSIKVRRFVALFLFTLPFALLDRVAAQWLIPFITMFVAYPLIALDQIGIELQNPFSKTYLSHLPLDEICAAIEGNLLGLAKVQGEAVK